MIHAEAVFLGPQPDRYAYSCECRWFGSAPPPIEEHEGHEITATPLGTRELAPFSKERLLSLFTSAPRAYWRFDVDLSLEAAVRMARFAQVAGIQGHWFLMTASPFYNIFSPEGRYAIAQIDACGHTLGLHCDHREGDPVKSVAVERGLLDLRYPGMFSNAVSFHMPGPEVLWKDFTPFFVNAYASEWQGRYLSDSKGEWDDEKVARVTNDAQICLHPEHWFGPSAA